MMPTKIYILIYIGSPLDYAKYRHTALFLEFPVRAWRLETNKISMLQKKLRSW